MAATISQMPKRISCVSTVWHIGICPNDVNPVIAARSQDVTRSTVRCSIRQNHWINQMLVKITVLRCHSHLEMIDAQCSSTSTGVRGHCRIALPIAPVKVRSLNGQHCVSTYALLDNGSTTAFCTRALAQSLRLDGKHETDWVPWEAERPQ